MRTIDIFILARKTMVPKH